MIPIDIICHNWDCPTITPPLRQDKALKSAWPEKPWFGTGWGEMAAESCPASRKGIEAFDLETLRKKVAIGWRNNFNKKLLRFALVPVEFFFDSKVPFLFWGCCSLCDVLKRSSCAMFFDRGSLAHSVFVWPDFFASERPSLVDYSALLGLWFVYVGRDRWVDKQQVTEYGIQVVAGSC